MLVGCLVTVRALPTILRFCVGHLFILVCFAFWVCYWFTWFVVFVVFGWVCDFVDFVMFACWLFLTCVW